MSYHQRATGLPPHYAAIFRRSTPLPAEITTGQPPYFITGRHAVPPAHHYRMPFITADTREHTP